MAPRDTSDPMEDVLNLEEHVFTEGKDQGLKDGTLAGRAEGFLLGLRAGSAKAKELGMARGRVDIWKHRADSLDLKANHSLGKKLDNLQELLGPRHKNNTVTDVEAHDTQSKKAVRDTDIVARILGEKTVGRPQPPVEEIDFTRSI